MIPAGMSFEEPLLDVEEAFDMFMANFRGNALYDIAKHASEITTGDKLKVPKCPLQLASADVRQFFQTTDQRNLDATSQWGSKRGDEACGPEHGDELCAIATVG